MMLLLFLIAAKTAPSPPATHVDDEAQRCIERFAKLWSQAQGVTYTLNKKERLRSGRVIYEELAVKLRKPQTIYVAQLKPQLGQEAIYDPRRDVEELLAHPGRFPDFTVSLDVFGRYATKDQHHPILHLGFDYPIAIMEDWVRRVRERPSGEQIRYLGEERSDGAKLHHVAIVGGEAPWRREAARDDDTVFTFAKRHGTDPYLVYYYNPTIDDFTDELDKGQRYRVAPYYSPRIDLWFDAGSGVLRRMRVHDYEGRLYEQFDYPVIALDPGLNDRDFDPDNPDYDF